MNQCMHAYAGENFLNSCMRFSMPKNILKIGNFGSECLWAGYSSNSTVSGDGNHFGS